MLFFRDMSHFGVPADITSDRGTQFTSSLWAALCSLLNIQHSQTTAYHWQSNGMVERFHRCLKYLPAAQRQTGWATSPGSSWVFAQQPYNTMALPPLRQCSAHDSFYQVNFWIHLSYLQKIFLSNSLRH
jgi:transposase InsO family protein